LQLFSEHANIKIICTIFRYHSSGVV